MIMNTFNSENTNKPDYKICGYDLKTIQNKMLEIIVEVDRVCRKNNIKYILDGGSLLGAVRHKGFIPWDDDLDIAMLREDYDRFINACKHDLSSDFFFQHYKSEKKYPLNFGKVRMKNTIYKEKLFSELDINQGIYIDVFPIDNVVLRRKKIQCRLISMLNSARFCKLGIYRGAHIKRLIYKPVATMSLNRINAIAEYIMEFNNKKRTEYVYKFCHQGKMKPLYKRSIYEDIIDIEFEGHKFYVPKEYDEFLSERYGDYMKYPPKEEQKPCHNIIKCELGDLNNG